MTRPRNIVLLSDGTGNARGKQHQTNVWRTYESLDLEDPARLPHPRQFAFYDDGVGTSSFKPIAMLGGALGYGLARNVRDLYEFLCRTYRDGDRIYAFGFSRGAFTIRVLLGLVCNQGLVPYRGDESELRRWSKAAFRAYRREKYRLPLNWIELPRALRDLAIDGWARLRGHTRYATVAQQRMVNIHFVGVWDTVAAYGMPIDELAIFIDKVIWPLDMPGFALSNKVERAAHALALDDERYTFHPKPWHPDPGRISQVWFAGMHSDVGGGYPDKGLAHVSLDWMLTQAADAGLRLLPTIRTGQQALADENGPMNDSRHGLAGYYRYKPRDLAPGSVVHESVLRRIQVGQDAYAPLVLPADFQVLGFDGVVRSGASELGNPDMAIYAAGREQALNRVWWRRGVYFATVTVTLVLLALPLLRSDDGAACTTGWCWLSPAIRALRVVLPGSAESWAVWYAANPGTFLLIGGLALFGLWLGGQLQLSIFDTMRRVWYAIPAARPTTVEAGYPKPRKLGGFGAALARLRNSGGYRGCIATLRRRVLPALAGSALAGVALMLASTLLFSIRASDGDFCASKGGAIVVDADQQTATFDTSDACAATGMRLQAGGTYDVVMKTTSPWRDLQLAADLRGIRDASLLHVLATPMRRELSQPVFRPMARIGETGADVYALIDDPSQPKSADPALLQTRIVARTGGELFVYVNDMVGPPGFERAFYDNNRGSGMVTVRQVIPPQR